MSKSTAPDWLRQMIGGEQTGPQPQQDATQSRPTTRLVFRPHSFGHYARRSILLVIMAALTSGMLAISIMLLMRTSPDNISWAIIGLAGVILFSPLILLVCYWIWAYLLVQRGRVVLLEDRLLEFNLFDQREIAYDQIYAATSLTDRGRTRCQVRYYPRGPLGEIDFLDLRWTYLIEVSDPGQLAEALQQRITGLQPSREARKRDLNRLTVFYATFMGGGLVLLGFMGLDKWVMQSFSAWYGLWLAFGFLLLVSWLASLVIVGARVHVSAA